MSGEEVVSCDHAVDYERLILNVLFANCTSLQVKGSLFCCNGVGCLIFSLDRTDLNGVSIFFFRSQDAYTSDNLELL